MSQLLLLEVYPEGTQQLAQHFPRLSHHSTEYLVEGLQHEVHEGTAGSRPAELVALLVVVEVAPEVFGFELFALVEFVVLGGEDWQVEEHVVLGGTEEDIGGVGRGREGGLLLAEGEDCLLLSQESIDLLQDQLDLEVGIGRGEFEFEHQPVHLAETQH